MKGKTRKKRNKRKRKINKISMKIRNGRKERT